MATLRTDLTRIAPAGMASGLPPVVPSPAPVRELLVESVFRAAVAPLPVRIAFPGGERLGHGGHGSPIMRIVRPRAFYRRVAVHGRIGFGEAYLAGDWTSTDLAGLLTTFATRFATSTPRSWTVLRQLVDRGRPPAERNTIGGARSNARRHYDLSNELFALFLDESMTYSSAWFGPSDDLGAAQLRKIDAVLDLAGVGAGARMLEIGSGWGALAIRAARRGALVTTLTNSREQYRLARLRVQQASLANRISVRLQDYREAAGRYDAVVSVEMIEAVGAEYWPVYFATLNRLLVPGGRVALQAITMPHNRMLATKDVFTWIDKYVFPCGQLPSVRAIEEHVGRWTDLRISARRRLGEHYARTLREWRERFMANRDRVSALGFDGTFQRLWEFYLAYSEAGFRTSFLDVWQFQLRPRG
jgi:cyclopropane-fatty-acyl-phospholipid synthase